MPLLKLVALIAVSVLVFGAGDGRAAEWPQRNVRVLVGFPAGSTPDLLARMLAEPLAKALGQPVIVENKAGASGNIATDQIAKATDDHTIGIVINGNLTSAKMLSPSLPYNPATDFAFLSLLATSPLLLAAPANLPGGAGYFTEARARGDKWSYGSVGVGSMGHLGMELLKSKLPGADAVHVPYQGNPAVISDLVAGQIHMALIPPSLAMAQVKAGRLQAIGLTGARTPLIPDVPSLAEFGISDYSLEVWNGLVGPSRLSPAARARLLREVPAIMKSADVRDRLQAQGWIAEGSTPEAFVVRVRNESAAMAAIIKAKNIRLN